MNELEELQALRRLAQLEDMEKADKQARLDSIKASNPGEYDPASPQWQAKYGATSGMSGLDKVRANLGAGMSDLWQGVKQRATDFGGDEGAMRRAQEDVAEKRAMDKKLADSQWGGGFTQGAGKAIPLIAASTLLPGSGLLATTASGVGSGAASGYIEPTVEGESANKNAAWGAALGGVLPLAVSGTGRAYRAVRGASQRRAEERIAQALGEGDSEAGRRAAAELIEQAPAGPAAGAAAPAAATGAGQAQPGIGAILGQNQNAAAAANRLQSQAGATGNLPLSVSARTQNSELARLEQASRLRNPELWRQFDETQAQALGARLQSATSEADEVARRIGARGEAYRTQRQAVTEAIDPAVFDDAAGGMREGVENAFNLPAAVNPEVRTALQETRRVLDTPGVSAEHLMELRKELTAGMKPGNVLRSADRSNPAILSAVNAIDNTLDALSDGAWRPVNANFAQASRGVEAGRAAQRVRDVFYDPASGLSRKTAQTAAGDVPMITEAALQRARDAGFDKVRRTSQFSPETTAGLDELSNAVRAQNIIQRLQRSATAGGGSGTASNLTALAQEEARQALLGGLISRSGAVGRGIAGVINAGDTVLNARADAIVARALQDEGAAAALFRQMQGPMEPELRRSIGQQLAAALRETPGKLAGSSLSVVPAVAATNK